MLQLEEGEDGGGGAAALCVVEVASHALRHEEARAVELRCAGIALARISCEYDFCARRLGVRCGYKALGDREKRHVHTLRARLLQPSAALLALGAATAARDNRAGEGGGASPLDTLTAGCRARWGV